MKTSFNVRNFISTTCKNFFGAISLSQEKSKIVLTREDCLEMERSKQCENQDMHCEENNCSYDITP